MKKCRKHDPIVPGKLIKLANGSIVASPARKSFLKKRGLSTPIHEATVTAFIPSQSSVESEPIRSEGKVKESYCQSKKRKLTSDFRKLFRQINSQIGENMYEEIFR